MTKFSDYFLNYNLEAFRFESLPEYNVQSEKEDFQSFIKTGKINTNKEFKSYLSNASIKLKKGIRHIRTRMIHNPLTNYQIFETYLGYIPLSNFGAEINIIEESKLKSIFNEIPSDFWLFDYKYLVVMEYDKFGNFIDFSIVEDPITINKYVEIRNTLIHNSNSFSFLKDKLFNCCQNHV